MDPDEEFWSTRTVAQRVGLSKSTPYRMIELDRFPKARRYRHSVKVYWLASEVRGWMEQQLVDDLIG